MSKLKLVMALVGVALIAGVSRAQAGASCAPGLDDVLVGVAIERERGRDDLITRLEFTDRTRPELSATVLLVGDRVLFDLRLGNASRRPRALYGRDVFRVALEEFGGRVRVVGGRWLAGVNLEQFYAAVAAGLGDDAAAAATWTGRMAAKYGFTRPRQQYPNGDRRIRNYVRYDFERP